MTLRRVVALTMALALAALMAWLTGQNPENLTLDDAARAKAPGRFVQLNDGSTHYRVEGPDSGSRVMLVHGFSVPSYIWDSTAAAFVAAGYRVARYDYFGRGWSDRPDVTYDQALYERQLGALLDTLGWREPVHLMGLSFGGAVTAGFTANHRDRVRTLTLIDPIAGTLGEMPWYLKLPGVGPMLWQAMAVPGMAAGQLSDFVESARWPDWPDRYRTQMQYKGFGRSLLRTRLAGAGTVMDSLYAAAGRSGVPALLIWGKEDQTVSIDLAPTIQRAMPQVQLHAIERAGHLPHMERTDVVNPLLLSFLRANEDSASAPAR